jgi:hypothetical protein
MGRCCFGDNGTEVRQGGAERWPKSALKISPHATHKRSDPGNIVQGTDVNEPG